MAHRKEEGLRPDVSPDENQERAHHIGYGCPPKETRFKPGKSGNPKGRPKRPPTLQFTVEKALKERVVLREGEHVQKVTKLDALVRTTLNRALKGDSKSVSAFLQMLQTWSGQGQDVVDTDPVISGDDETILADYLARHGASISPFEEQSDQDESSEQANDCKFVGGKT
jgi:hypothetical protein